MEIIDTIEALDMLLAQHRGLLSAADESRYSELLTGAREIIAPEGEEQPELPLELLRLAKTLELKVYDASDAVNAFTIGGQPMWIAPDERANYLLTIEAAQEKGVETIPFAGINLPVATALAALKAINLYAMQCVTVTMAHEAAIAELTSAADIARYDFTAGYPEKLSF